MTQLCSVWTLVVIGERERKRIIFVCILLQAILYGSHDKLNVARDLLYKASSNLAAATDDYRVSLASCVLFCLVLNVLCRLSCLLPSLGLLSSSVLFCPKGLM